MFENDPPPPPSTPSSEDPSTTSTLKSPFEFDIAKWEQQQSAENGGIDRACFAVPSVAAMLIFFAFSTHRREHGLRVPRFRLINLFRYQSIIDEDLFDDPNIDLEVEYLGQ